MNVGEILERASKFAQLGNLQRAIDELSKLQSSNFKDHFDILSSRYEIIKKQWRADELTSEEYSVEQNKITKSIFETISIVEKELKIEKEPEEGFDNILDKQFQNEVQRKGKKIIGELLNLQIRNENLILSYLHLKESVSIEHLESKSGFKKKKVNRILQRLKVKNQVARNAQGWVRLEE